MANPVENYLAGRRPTFPPRDPERGQKFLAKLRALNGPPLGYPSAPPALPNAVPSVPLAAAAAGPSAESIELGTRLHAAIQDENVKESLRLIAAGASLSVRHDYGDTALINACRKALLPVAVAILAIPDVDVNAKNDFDETALMFASERGSTDLVETLLDKGADIHAEHVGREPALIWAIRALQANNALLLIERGAAPDRDAWEDVVTKIGLFTRFTPGAPEKMAPVRETLMEKIRGPIERGGYRQTKKKRWHAKKHRKTKHRIRR